MQGGSAAPITRIGPDQVSCVSPLSDPRRTPSSSLFWYGLYQMVHSVVVPTIRSVECFGHLSHRLKRLLTWWNAVHQCAVGGIVERRCAAKIRPAYLDGIAKLDRRRPLARMTNGAVRSSSLAQLSKHVSLTTVWVHGNPEGAAAIAPVVLQSWDEVNDKTRQRPGPLGSAVGPLRVCRSGAWGASQFGPGWSTFRSAIQGHLHRGTSRG